MTGIDDTLLMAYVDGELDAEETARVERLLARDGAARETVRSLTALNGLLGAAYADALREPAPEALSAQLHAAAAEDAAAAKASPSRPTRRLPRLAVAAAVPLLIATGGALGMLWTMPGGRDDAAPDAVAASFLETKRQAALETHLSGETLAWREASAPVGAGEITPLKTYRAEGGYCREYRETVSTAEGPRTTIGLACRQDGAWRVRYELRMGEDT